MDLEYTWQLLSSNSYNDEFWVYGFTGTDSQETVFWDFYTSLVAFAETLPNPYDEDEFSIYWAAYLRIYDILQTPTLYQGALPKYKFGTWAKSYAGIAFEDGFINYQYQSLCSGYFCTQQNLYVPYGTGEPYFPTSGALESGALTYPNVGDVSGLQNSPKFGDSVYTKLDVPAFQELFLYATVNRISGGADGQNVILL